MTSTLAMTPHTVQQKIKEFSQLITHLVINPNQCGL